MAASNTRYTTEDENNEQKSIINLLEDDHALIPEADAPPEGLLYDCYRLLLRRLDCAGNLPDRLLGFCVITDVDRKMIWDKNGLNYYKANKALLHLLARRYPQGNVDIETFFLRALIESNQSHIEQLIHAHRIKDLIKKRELLETSDALIDEEISKIENHSTKLCELLLCDNSLLEKLEGAKCIRREHRETIEKTKNTMKGKQFLIDIVKRGTLKKLKKFLEILRQERQQEAWQYVHESIKISRLDFCEYYIIAIGSDLTHATVSLGNTTILSLIELNNSYPARIIEPPLNLSTVEGCGSCISGNVLFFLALDQMFKYLSSSNQWQQCAPLPTSRCYASIESVGNSIFILGGILGKRSVQVLQHHFIMNSKVLKYSIEDNVWTVEGNIEQRVEQAASVAYGNYIYLFGGYDKEENITQYLQKYNIVTKECTVSKNNHLPSCGQIRAVKYRRHAVIVGMNDILLYDLKQEMFIRTVKCEAHRRNFGLTINSGVLYLVGGSGTGDRMRDRSKEINKLRVKDIINLTKSLAWQHHSDLPEASQMQVCSRRVLRKIPIIENWII